MSQLNAARFLKFPLTIGADGGAQSDRLDHVREQIVQVLYTDPGERWFRQDFGVGIQRLVFEPNSAVLRDLMQKRILASLSEALAGEVDPASLRVTIEDDPAARERMIINISYTLATINRAEQHRLTIGGDK